MLHLMCLPVGQSAADTILPRACKQDRQRTLVVTASGMLVRKVRLAGLNAANFDYLANDILRQCGRTEVRLLSRKAQELLLQEVLESLQKQNCLPYFARLRERKGFLRSMASLMGELGRSGATVDELEEALKHWDRDGGADTETGMAKPAAEPGARDPLAPGYGQKDREVGLIYRAYRAYLKKYSVYDVEGLYRLAAASLAALEADTGIKGSHKKLKWDTLYFIGFYHFDALELQILEVAARFCDVWVVLPYEGNRSELYNVAERTYGDLMGLSAQLEPAGEGNGTAASVPLPAVSASAVVSPDLFSADVREEGEASPAVSVLQAPVRLPALGHLLSNLRRENPRMYPAEGTVEIWETVDRTEEMRAVLRHIKRLAAAGAGRLCDTAVVVRDLNAYSGFVSLCGEYGLPVNLPRSASLSANPLFVFMQLALSVAGNRGRREVEAWLTLLRQPLLAVLFNVEAGEADRLSASRYYTEAEPLLEEIAALPGREGMQELIDRIRELPKQATAAGYSERLAGLLELLQVRPRLGEAYRNGALTLEELKNMACGEEEIRRLLQKIAQDYQSCGQEDKFLQSGAFADVLTEEALPVTVVLQGRNEQGISVLTASALEDMRYRYVYVLGLVEGEFPFYKNENWIYSDRERSVLKSLGVELPDSAAGYREDAYFFANACAAATEHLILTYFRGEDETPSLYVDEVKAVFSDLETEKKMPARQEVEALSQRELELALARSGESERLNNLTVGGAPGGVGEPAFLAALTEAALTDRERLADGKKYNGQLSDPLLLERLFRMLGSEYSPSRLETYLGCPFRFLVSDAWQKQEAAPVEEDLDPGRRGTLLHRVLERFLRRHLKETLPERGEESLRRELDDIFDEVCREEEEQGRIYAGPFWEKDKEQQRRLLHRWLRSELLYSPLTRFRPIAVERCFGESDGGVRFRVREREIILKGRIDRIDSDGRQIFITDYKSGRVPANSAFLQSDLQMPLYILAASEQGLSHGMPVAGGGYYSLKEGRREKSFLFRGADAALPVKTFSEACLPGTEEKVPLGNVEELRGGMQVLVTGLLQRIATGDFTPTPSERCDRFCPAADICRFCILQNREEEDGHEEG